MRFLYCYVDLKAASVFSVVALQYQSFLSPSVKGPSVCQGELQQLLKKNHFCYL